MSVDPLADKYPGWTPYHYVLNNPVKYIDPTGMEVEYNSFKDRVRTFFTRIFDKGFRKDFAVLKKSDDTYVFNGSNSKGGNFTSDGQKVYINYEFNSKNDKLGTGKNTALKHETEHAVQFEHGELGFKKVGSNWAPISYDMTDEVKAFKDGSYAKGSRLTDYSGNNTFQGDMRSLNYNSSSSSSVAKSNASTILKWYKSDPTAVYHKLLPTDLGSSSKRIQTPTLFIRKRIPR